MRTPDSKLKHSIHIVYFVAVIFTYGHGLQAYISSTFFTDVTGSESIVSVIYTAGSILSIVMLAFIPFVLKKIGNYRTSTIAIILGAIALTGIALSNNSALLIFLFIIYLVVLRLLVYNFDLLLEHYSRDKTTGRIRGAYLSIVHVALALAPLTAGIILGEGNFSRLYLLAATVFAILVLVLTYYFRDYKDPEYKHTPFWRTVRNIHNNRDLREIFTLSLLLRSFYAWMLIYTPIYLHTHIMIPWNEIGIIFAIMLLPFIFLEYPLGRLADTKLGEKEIMTLGFLILAITSGFLSFITSSQWWIWAIALLATRIGASMVESMEETYFFKKIDDHDSELLGFFKMIPPLAYAIAPIIASIVLFFVDFRFLFLFLGAGMLLGVYYGLKLKDTL